MMSIIERWFGAGDSGDLVRFEEILGRDVVVRARTEHRDASDDGA
jgi:hypothetical protein